MKLTESNFLPQIFAYDMVIVAWCAYDSMMCKIMNSTLEKLESDYKIGYVDLDRDKALGDKYGINSIPSLSFFSKGEKLQTIVGLHSDNQIREIIEKLEKREEED